VPPISTQVPLKSELRLPASGHHREQGPYLGTWKSKASQVEYDRLIGEWLQAGRPALPAAPVAVITGIEICAAFWKFAQGHYMKNGRSRVLQGPTRTRPKTD
jgi:hypothetical protein